MNEMPPPLRSGARIRRGACRSFATTAAVTLVAIVGGCSDSSDRPSTATPAADPTTTTAPSTSTTDTTTTTTMPSTVAPSAQTLFETVCSGAPAITDAGVIAATEITEASGLVASRDQPGVWWVHNDSGDSARIFAIDDTGQLLSTVDLADAESRDWEDITIGPGASPEDPDLLYVGDIGDNALLQNDVDNARESIRVYRLEEPRMDSAVSTASRPPPPSQPLPLSQPLPTDTLTLVYPDGPHDAESLLVDPVDGNLFVVTKDWARVGASEVYRAPTGLEDGSTTTLEHVATVAIEPGTLVSGADISPDGTVVALRSYGAVDLYAREPGTPLWSAFEQTPCAGPVPSESQGEAIGFAADGASYMTVSEGAQPVLHRTTG